MKLSMVEKERSGLVSFLVIVIMICLALIMFLAYRQQQGYAIPALAIVSLLACLYAIVKERKLAGQQAQLVEELVERERRIQRLGTELEKEQAELEEEKGKSEALDMRLQEVAALYRAISTVNAVPELDDVSGAILSAALELVGGDCGSIMLLDDKKENLVIATAQGLSEEVVRETRQPVGQGIAGWVAEHGEPVLLTGDVESDRRFQDRIIDRGLRLEIAMSTPLVLRGTVLGVLNLGSSDEGSRQRFADLHLRIATIFGQHASVSLRNVQLTKLARHQGRIPESGF